ncbi:MAG TPA: hypothetical protein VI233_15265 [Puia sp.]
MKTVLTILFPLITLCAAAQTHLPIGGWGYGLAPWQSVWNLPSYDSRPKWQIKPFASISAGYIFFNGGISYVSAPMGVAAFRPLNPNWTAFGAATVSPTVFSINRLMTAPTNTGYGTYINTGIQGGLIYTNEAKTFSISGSIRIDRGSYPVYPVDNKRYSKFAQ